MVAGGDLDALPGFRRRFVVTPGAGRVTAAVEDDYHCMAVTLHHDGATIGAVDPVMERAPWTTCPGAPVVLRETFTGVALADAAARGEKRSNCTHLHDLATLAAAHAGDAAPSTFDILTCDAIDGEITAEIRLNGTALVTIAHRDDVMTAPEAIAGSSLFKLRGWIDALAEPRREAARLLQWGTIIAHGRAIPLARQSDAGRMPPNCFTFQPENRLRATRVGRVVDFTAGGAGPLDHFDGTRFGVR